MMLSLNRPCLMIVLCLFANGLYAQSLLSRKVSLEIKQQRLDDALSVISNKGNFSFSYSSNIIKRDSVVNLAPGEYSIREALSQLLGMGYEFKESGNYIILRKVAIRVTSIVQQTASAEDNIVISGYILNGETGDKISNASIYEPNYLASTLSNEQGRFSIKLKSRHRSASLYISKDSFEDTTVTIRPTYNMQLEISMVPVLNANIQSTGNRYESTDRSLDIPALNTDSISPFKHPKTVEQTRLAKIFLTTNQKIQSLNIRNFFKEKSAQISFVPGFSTDGHLSSQVISKFSFNIIGGYTGGVDVAELGGVFNINRKNTRYFQAAGVFNLTGGQVAGFQVAGVHNSVLKNMYGVQVAGVSNHVRSSVTGVQLGGIANLSHEKFSGAQVAGIVNNHIGSFKGTQIAGILNSNTGELKGVQVSGILNHTRKLRGVQVGLINISDSSDGYSIGLVNIVLKGYHKLALSTNETTNLNIAFKSGSQKLYSILQAGTNAGNKNGKVYTMGYGLGTEIKTTNWLTVNPELSASYAYVGDWEKSNILNRFNLQFNCKLGKKLSLFAGPSFTLQYSDLQPAGNGYKFPIVSSASKKIFNNNHLSGWIGWNAGINLF